MTGLGIVEHCIHPAIRQSPRLAARHRAFVAQHTFGPIFVIAALPIFIWIAGMPGLMELVAVAWLVSPIALAFLLRRTARIELCRAISMVNFAGLITFLALFTGGLRSFLLPWLVVLPGEAALSGRQSTIFGATALAVISLAIVSFLTFQGWLPAAYGVFQAGAAFDAIGAFAAIIYASGMAISANTFSRASEMAAREGAARYRFLADHVADMIMRHGPDGRITYVSPASHALLGVEPNELIGRRPAELVHPDDIERIQSAFARAVYYGSDVSIEFRFRHVDGAYVWVESKLRSVPMAREAAAIEFITVSRDISSHKAYEDALVAARDEAQAASRAKSRFLAHMSHELRTPLNAIIGFSEVMRDQMFGPIGSTRYREYAGMIHESGGHLLDLINDVLDMSKIEAGKYELAPERLDIRDLISGAVTFMRRTADDKGLKLKTSVADGMPPIMADRRALKQILLNLLSNAIKFTPAGGTITISTDVGGGHFHLVVTDTGCGIPDEAIARLGRPFEQAHDNAYARRVEGTGLGLAVVRALTELHGGKLTIDSALDAGTTVTISIPALHAVTGGSQAVA